MIQRKKNICVITTGRCDYGLLRGLMREIDRDVRLHLQVIVTGMHLEKEFGRTCRFIEQDGIRVSRKIPVSMDGTDALSACRSLSRGFAGFAPAYRDLKPDMVVVLGDRYEVLPAVVCAALCRIPVAHIHGGEVTEGAVDDMVRHAITKFSTYHFASTRAYARRIVSMGEAPDRVFCFGAPGADAIHGMKFPARETVYRHLGIAPGRPCAVITYHPVTLETRPPDRQIEIVLAALQGSGISGVFTMANADPGGAVINRRIRAFCRKHARRFFLAANPGQAAYLSCLKHCDLVIGNSSSGIIEAASFGVPVVDIGIRQKGRIRGANVLHADLAAGSIRRAITRALSEEFKGIAARCRNPYDPFGDGKTGQRIKQELKRAVLRGVPACKGFYDVAPLKGAVQS